MRIQLSRNGIAKTFGFYLIIIAIPLGILAYQGVTSLEMRLEQARENQASRMEKNVASFINQLREEWFVFLEKEKIRGYTDYKAVNIPDVERFNRTGQGAERGPLYAETITRTSRLNYVGVDNDMSARASSTLAQIMENSLVGYFEYDHSTHTISSPYDPLTIPKLKLPEEHEESVRVYRQFLVNELRPRLRSRLFEIGGEENDPFGVLVYLKTPRIQKLQYQINETGDSVLVESEAVSEELVRKDVGLYEFSFFTLPHYVADKKQNQVLIVGFRPVLITWSDDRPMQLLIQGFLFNSVPFIQEVQGYLEPFQMEFGDLVVHEMKQQQSNTRALFEPFQSIAVRYQITDSPEILDNYRAEKNRFWLVLTCLLLALAVTMIHLSKLVSGHIDLYRRKNNFVSAVTHELKAPLTSIIMYAEMLEEGWAKGKEQKYYHYIHWESDRLTRLIKNILDYSGLERGSFVFSPACSLLHEFVRNSLEPLNVWTENNGLALEVIIRHQPEVMVDRDSLSQVIYNLCDNTIKYGMSAEQPTLTLEVTQNDEYGILKVSDNGSGIPKGDETKVFDRFFRCENEMTRERTGTGLGLALVRELVEGNNGKIELFRPKNGGFGVSIYLPRATIDAMAVA
ncbi:MAG: HAMP domain-containing sensor histidine kinase [Acidobacteriota bacterium]|nr:HAMP domain-containing sensor histidine kinase [Acidobacteriota bacterium]